MRREGPPSTGIAITAGPLPSGALGITAVTQRRPGEMPYVVDRIGKNFRTVSSRLIHLLEVVRVSFSLLE